MMRSMFSGIAGLRNHQTRMDVIGNNIANVNTMGYKSSRVTFQEIFSQTLRGPSSPTPQLGGTDPMQVGLGMTVSGIDMINTPGNIQTTGQVTDMALQGEGYFVVSDGPTTYYTRAGDFKIDGTDYLTNSKGFRVMGWTAVNGVFEPKTGDNLSSVRVSIGEVEGTQVEGTAWPANDHRGWVLDITNGLIRDTVSLDDLTIAGLPEGLTATAQKDPTGNRIIVTVSGSTGELTDVPATVSIVVGESAITAADSVASTPFTFVMDQVASASAVATDSTIAMNAGNTTVSANNSWGFEVTSGVLKDTLLVSDVTVTGLPAGLTWAVSKDPTGNRVLLTVGGIAGAAIVAPATVNVVVKGSALMETGAADAVAIPVTINPAGSPVTIAGSLADASVVMDADNTSATAADRWVLDVTQGTVDWPLQPGDITVAGLPAGLTAAFTQGANASQIVVEVQGIAGTPLAAPVNATITLNGGAVTEAGAVASAAFPVRIEPRVIAPEATVTMSSFTVDSAGVLTGSFSDGTSRAIAQVAVASFANARGLIRQGDGLLSTSNNSGLAEYGTAGTQGRGLIAPSSLEMSNVDLASEFTNMIITQRGFQANSRIITTSDEMLQELTNLKR